LSAKYWLLNHLTSENLVTDGFFDNGFVGINPPKMGPFPSLSELQAQPLNKNREAIVIDFVNDVSLNGIYSFLADNIGNIAPEGQIKMIALAISKHMGGPVSPEKYGDFNYKFKIAEMKQTCKSNVLPIGQITHGTFYHRALLFKALCDHLGLKPCSLHRGEYNRAWNITDTKNQTVTASLAKTGAKKASAKQSKPANTSAPVPAQAASPESSKIQYLGLTDIDYEPYQFDEPAIVDLMFFPGRLLPVSSPEAARYTRICLD
jgi:hypothetical protein